VSAATSPKGRKNAGRGGRRPTRRTGGPGGRPGSREPGDPARYGKALPEGVRVTGGARPVPFERNRATAILGGIFGFLFGFAVAGVLVVADQAVTPPYYVAIAVGVVGIAVLGVSSIRGSTPMPATPIWSRDTLRLMADAALLPATVVMVVLYTLAAISVLGNLVYPLVFGV
jgi:hypothetical protein